MAEELDPAIWKFHSTEAGKSQASCMLCNPDVDKFQDISKCRRHEGTEKHNEALQVYRQQTEPSVGTSATTAILDQESLADESLRRLFSDPSGSLPSGTAYQPYSSASQSVEPEVNWTLLETMGDGQLDMSQMQRIATLAQGFEEWEVELSDADDGERSEDALDDDEDVEPVIEPEAEGVQHPRKRQRRQNADELSREWFPWPDRITCTLDIVMHLSRSNFSERQIELFLWMLLTNRVDDVPSVRQMKDLDRDLQKLCGIDTLEFQGGLGHRYFTNSLAQIIAQEMANPRVRPKLEFYPEDTGRSLSEARQAKHWLQEIPHELITPMTRVNGRDFYVFEPAMFKNGRLGMPVRWFKRAGVLFAKCWDMVISASAEKGTGWRVVQHQTEVAEGDFLLNFPEVMAQSAHHEAPPPSIILDIFNPASNTSSEWTLTDATVGNRWRAIASGLRVLCFPIWLYCDDTSGNVSKKWNEHNSFLFTPAGLPREEMHKEYNVHFLCTSNTARPLEMLEGIADQLDQLQEKGVRAWDVVFQEPVLMTCAVLAILGDNPMQSEFACHIGLAGRMFCRSCWVEGSKWLLRKVGKKDAAAGQKDDSGESDAGNASDASETGSVGSALSQTDTGSVDAISGAHTESSPLEELFGCLKKFITPGQPRHRNETIQQLDQYWSAAAKVGSQASIKRQRTASGIKDTFQLHFLDQLFTSYKKKRGVASKQAALDARLSALPTASLKLRSPVWRLKGIDPHQDTPVEILHVVLLGFVKYLWRDVVQNQLQKKDDRKQLLIDRLCSFNVSGLGFSPLQGRTLVQYAGSLTGRDFRALSQAAPFVLYDLVNRECFTTWVCLSKMVPLIWQPYIEDVDAHLNLLESEIENFLVCAARWTCRWYNKPKFHILVHLLEHIRRFGPGILFATEGFESFNAVIRGKSVHSNRQAPSRDIARAFAQGNRIRHLLSGGLFLPKVSEHRSEGGSGSDPVSGAGNQNAWSSAGPGPMQLVATPTTITHYLGFGTTVDAQKAVCVLDKKGQQQSSRLQTFQKASHLLPLDHTLRRFQTADTLYLEDGTSCKPGDFLVIADVSVLPTTVRLGRLVEVVQTLHSSNAISQRPDIVLVQLASTSAGSSSLYGMPYVHLIDEWMNAPLQHLKCSVNVQHACAEENCSTSGVRTVYQERQQTEQTRAIVVHSNPDRLVLNTAQMRDASWVQKFRVTSPRLTQSEIDNILRQSAEAEIASRKSKQSVGAQAPGRGRGQGRGRGPRGRGSGNVTTERPQNLRLEALRS